MSYAVALCIDTGAREPHRIVDCTVSYNLSPIFRSVIGPEGLRTFDGLPADYAWRSISHAIRRLRQGGPAVHGEEGFEEALCALEWLRSQALTHPKAQVFVR